MAISHPAQRTQRGHFTGRHGQPGVLSVPPETTMARTSWRDFYVYAAGCWYRDGFGTRADGVQAMRWYFTMLGRGDGDGIHDAIALLKAASGTEEQVREAGRLAQQPAAAESVISTVRGRRPGTGR
ncbi:hypothetical protein [Streptomyces sp. NPDC096324]|uniref:hypothetical protein n=1 Tax=Streptomyces sp. NPDC096324 TaxID=3366085 RepID=UPI00382DDA4F